MKADALPHQERSLLWIHLSGKHYGTNVKFSEHGPEAGRSVPAQRAGKSNEFSQERPQHRLVSQAVNYFLRFLRRC